MRTEGYWQFPLAEALANRGGTLTSRHRLGDGTIARHGNVERPSYCLGSMRIHVKVPSPQRSQTFPKPSNCIASSSNFRA